jgi:hypothetical protein
MPEPEAVGAFRAAAPAGQPDLEVRAIAKGAATSMPLKQAALKRIQGLAPWQRW